MNTIFETSLEQELAAELASTQQQLATLPPPPDDPRGWKEAISADLLISRGYDYYDGVWQKVLTDRIIIVRSSLRVFVSSRNRVSCSYVGEDYDLEAYRLALLKAQGTEPAYSAMLTLIERSNWSVVAANSQIIRNRINGDWSL